MRVGFVGLGLLGLPMAVAIASRGHAVRGFDAQPQRMDVAWYPAPEYGPGQEPLATLAARVDFGFASLQAVVEHAEIIFVTVQTPNLGGYNGSGPYAEGGAQYDLRPLRLALEAVAGAAAHASAIPRVLAIVSTVLPGTVRELARSLPQDLGLSLAHTPAFSAVGTIMADLLDPEFVLIGALDATAGQRLQALYHSLTAAPMFVTTPENAELIKTSYNGYIGLKIGFANALMELSHKTPGCDVDEVVRCLSLATRRLHSPRYLAGGLGGGGGCHPKENAALAALAARVGLSFDPFGANLVNRDRQTSWLAGLVASEYRANPLPVWLLGTAFKANVAVEDGSPALLLHAALLRRGLSVQLHDPLVPGRDNPPPPIAAIFVLAVPHAAFEDFVAAPGSVVVDPWRRVQAAPGVRVLAVGRGEPVRP